MLIHYQHATRLPLVVHTLLQTCTNYPAVIPALCVAQNRSVPTASLPCTQEYVQP